MGKRKGRQRGDDSSSSDASSGDGMSTEETRSTISSRKIRSKEAKGIKRMLKELKDELKQLNDELKQMLEERKYETSRMKKELKKLNENQIVLCRRLEQLNGSSGDVSPAPRSEPNQMQPPRFHLRITSKVKDKVGKGESILTEHGDPINIVLYDGGNVIANDHPLASASVMMVVLNGEFNKDDIKYNWSKEDFQKSIRRPREGNSATGDVNKIIESTVIGSTFNLAGGSCSLRDAKISENSSNKKVRLGVMVVSQTEERVLEGLSNRFLVRDPPKKSKLTPIDSSSTVGNNTEQTTRSSTLGNNTEQATRSSTPGNSTHTAHLQCLPPVADLLLGCEGAGAPASLAMFSKQPSSYTGRRSTTSTMCNMMDPLPYSPNGLEYILRPVQLLWDRPDVEPSKRWNLLDQLMPLYSRQPKIQSVDFPTMRLMPEHYDSLTTYPQGPYQRLFLMKMMRNLQNTTIPKEVMQTHRNRGVLSQPLDIQPLEPDDSDDEPLLKRKLPSKYQLRFVNKVCEAYYTREQIKADDGNLLNVALYDENNSKITSGPLSSASVDVVVLHGDFNANGQDYWTSEEFSSCVVRPRSGKGRSALVGDRVLVLVDGEASVGYAFFQTTSSFARTGKFKMGVKMKITMEERIKEGISESFFVTSRRGKGLNSNSKPPLICKAKGELLEEGFTTLKGGDSDIFAKLKAEDMEHVCKAQDLKDLPAVIPHPTHTVHEFKLLTTGGAQFRVHDRATGDFYERQMELLKEEMRCMSQGHKEGLESIRREMQEFYQKNYTDFSEMRKQQDRVALMAEISRCGGYVQQSPDPRVSSDQNCVVTLRLQFENSCSTDKYSTHEIEADDGTPLKVAIYDYNNRIVTYEPFSSMRVHIVAIHGDFDDDHKGQWTDDYFRSKIVPGRPIKEHLLSGKLYFRLQNGLGYLNGVKFQDNSSFVPSKRFKLAVMADDQRITERIQEGITESFAVKDVRGYPSKKNPYPSPSDPVHKLTRIAINGDRHKALENNKIKTVEDFLCSYSKDEKKLRKILGNISDHDWNKIVEHAHRCNPRKEMYSQCIQERNMPDEQEPIFRNSGSSNLRGSCSMQPSPTEQARFHEQVDIRVMHQQISSTYNGLSSGVPLENVGSESSAQPNTSDQHVMPYEHLRVIKVTNQQISSTENEFLPVSSIDNTLKGFTSLQPDSLECNIVHDGNEIPSTSVENILDGSISMQDNPPEHGTMLHDGLPHQPRATNWKEITNWKKIVTTVTAASSS